jgi:hypothetical protein
MAFFVSSANGLLCMHSPVGGHISTVALNSPARLLSILCRLRLLAVGILPHRQGDNRKVTRLKKVLHFLEITL